MNGANGRYSFYKTIPAIIGLEQEIPIYRVITDSSSPGESTPSVIQLRGIELQIYLYSFVSSQYPEAAVWKSEHGFASTKGYAVHDGRVYRDQDLVELATAECMNPFELAARISAMRENLREFIANSNGAYIAYCDSGEDIHGFSFHENYLAQKTQGLLSSDPANFLVSRAVLTGTGGPAFHENTFCLSPRLSYTQSDS
ncbi:MAG TPA: proteasome accessory factor PafA2 family protein, partial [Acidimicrobiia bacterium]|nr:proteasome accessory factor PafA2 family protein [Acidimicrobiia bacterium]